MEILVLAGHTFVYANYYALTFPVVQNIHHMLFGSKNIHLYQIIHYYSHRYILSASDYGERKLLMWDSGMPRIEQPAQFAHMIFWTTEGLIKKILIKEYTPDDSFWLSEDQLDLLGDDFELEVWPGELDPDIIMDSDSDKSNSDDEEEEEDTFGKDDVRENEGAFLGVIATDSKTRVQSEAFEYIPGGSLVISVQVCVKCS